MGSDENAVSRGAGRWPGVMAGASLILRLQLGAIFLFAAYQKLQGPTGPRQFLSAIKSFKLGLPDWLASFTTFAMPWTEVICAVALIIGLWTRAAALVVGAMLILFIAVLYSAMARKLNLEHCGCFGERGLFCGGAPGWCHIIENLVMIGAAALIFATRRHTLAADCLLGGRRTD